MGAVSKCAARRTSPAKRDLTRHSHKGGNLSAHFPAYLCGRSSRTLSNWVPKSRNYWFPGPTAAPWLPPRISVLCGSPPTGSSRHSTGILLGITVHTPGNGVRVATVFHGIISFVILPPQPPHTSGVGPSWFGSSGYSPRICSSFSAGRNCQFHRPPRTAEKHFRVKASPSDNFHAFKRQPGTSWCQVGVV